MYPTVYSDVEDYPKVWELTNREVYYNDKNTGVLATFPNDISKLNVIDFYCFHYELIVGQPNFQIHLAVKYNEEDYSKEVQRLKTIKALRNIRYDTENLLDPAYVAVWNWSRAYEYAICHAESHTIDYVYFQAAFADNLKLDQALFPKGFTGEGGDIEELRTKGDAGDVLGFDSFTIYE